MKEKRLVPFLITFLLCFAFWLLLTLSVSVKELGLGVVVCGVSAWFSCGYFVQDDKNSLKMFNPVRLVKAVIYFLFIFSFELIKANLAMAAHVLFNKPIKQAIVKVPVKGIKDEYGLALLANCITMTPGTITLDVVEGKGDVDAYMYVQWICMTEKDAQKAGDIIKGNMEKWIRGIFA